MQNKVNPGGDSGSQTGIIPTCKTSSEIFSTKNKLNSDEKS
jgi:hypothetical protein